MYRVQRTCSNAGLRQFCVWLLIKPESRLKYVQGHYILWTNVNRTCNRRVRWAWNSTRIGQKDSTFYTIGHRKIVMFDTYCFRRLIFQNNVLYEYKKHNSDEKTRCNTRFTFPLCSKEVEYLCEIIPPDFHQEWIVGWYNRPGARTYLAVQQAHCDLLMKSMKSEWVLTGKERREPFVNISLTLEKIQNTHWSNLSILQSQLRNKDKSSLSITLVPWLQ